MSRKVHHDYEVGSHECRVSYGIFGGSAHLSSAMWGSTSLLKDGNQYIVLTTALGCDFFEKYTDMQVGIRIISLFLCVFVGTFAFLFVQIRRYKDKVCLK